MVLTYQVRKFKNTPINMSLYLENRSEQEEKLMEFSFSFLGEEFDRFCNLHNKERCQNVYTFLSFVLFFFLFPVGSFPRHSSPRKETESSHNDQCVCTGNCVMLITTLIWAELAF